MFEEIRGPVIDIEGQILRKRSKGVHIKSLQTELEITGNENKHLTEENEDKNVALANLGHGLDK